MKSIKIIFSGIIFSIVAIFLFSAPEVRIKDIAYLQGVRENQLSGVGLVTGLSGRGDSSNSSLLKTAVANLLANFGLQLDPEEVRSRNCAVVMVTAEVPAFVRSGDRINLTISSIGDARSLEGGILLQTPLRAANGRVYAVGQGKVLVSTERNGIKTVGFISSGAIVETDVLSSYITNGVISVVLRNADFVTADTVAEAIRVKFEGVIVRTVDASLIEITVPQARQGNLVGFIAELESLTVTPDASNKVVIDSVNSVVIMGEGVKIGKVAVSYKKVNVSVGNYYFAAESEQEQNFVFEEMVTVDDFVSTLNKIGLSTETIIGILQAIERAGALYGRLIIM